MSFRALLNVSLFYFSISCYILLIYSRGQGSLIQVKMLEIRARKLAHRIKMLATPDDLSAVSGTQIGKREN